MPVNRAPFNALVDDDGSNTVGSVWSKAQIAGVILDPVDAALATLAAASSGAWTPVDASGAGLVLSVSAARWVRVGNLVSLHVNMTYPATANGAAARIGGLPVANGSCASGFYVCYGLANYFNLAAFASQIAMFNPTSLAGRTNAELSGATVNFSGVYSTV